jgi:outer membrane protein OmpA-like peptidoglycan-associated protein
MKQWISLYSTVRAVLAAAVSLPGADLLSQAPAAPRAANVAAASAGARLVSHSTQYDADTWKAANIIDGKTETGWSSSGGTVPQTLVIELPGEFLLSRFSFDNGGTPDYSVKDVKVSVSIEAEDLGFRDAGAYTLNKGESAQGFRLPAPTRARWIKLTVTSHYGGRYIYLMEFRAMGLPATQQTAEDDSGFRVMLSSEVLFDTDQSALRPDGEKALNETLGILLEFPSARLLVEGHTDSTGTMATNQALSEARANSVRDWLDSHRGSARWTIDTKGSGATKPAASNATPTGRQRNRRVEITILR